MVSGSLPPIVVTRVYYTLGCHDSKLLFLFTMCRWCVYQDLYKEDKITFLCTRSNNKLIVRMRNRVVQPMTI